MSKASNYFGLIALLAAFVWTYLPGDSTAFLSFLVPKASPEHQNSSVESDICESPSYTARILSFYPLIIHLEDFITPLERQHILNLSDNQFEESTVLHENGSYLSNPIRTSTTFHLSEYDPVVSCLSRRFSEFQGYHPEDEMETFQVTRYQQNQFYGEHYDWFSPQHTPHTDGANRLTTGFGIVDADCENCGTRFPRVKIDWKDESPEWCKFVDCADSRLTVKPIPGSLLFWRNLYPNGEGDPGTLHAGMPLTNGHKVGLNIWSITRNADPESLLRNPMNDAQAFEDDF